jgi:hypothetical protein
MQHLTHVVGVDPGIVDTGVVRMVFDPDEKLIMQEHRVFTGINGSPAPANQVDHWILRADEPDPVTFVEGYRPRSHLATDARMMAAVQEYRSLKGSTVLPNMGVKKVVRRPLMELLGVWKFSTVTHHQDLRSAARIALLGMMKDEQMNHLLADVVRDHLNGQTWQVKS